MPNLWYDNHRKLSRGDHGLDVEQLQRKLQNVLDMNTALEPDGSFGANTKKAVIKFQREMGLIDDGIVGTVTHAVVFRNNFTFAPVTPPVVLQKSAYVCWAASLQSVLGRSWIGRKKMSISDLRNKYERFIGPRGDITGPGLVAIGRDFRFRDITHHFIKSRRIHAETLIKLLHAKRPLLLLNLAEVGHARIIYGVKIVQGSIHLLLMDPMIGYTEVPLNNIQPTVSMLGFFAANEVHL